MEGGMKREGGRKAWQRAAREDAGSSVRQGCFSAKLRPRHEAIGRCTAREGAGGLRWPAQRSGSASIFSCAAFSLLL